MLNISNRLNFVFVFFFARLISSHFLTQMTNLRGDREKKNWKWKFSAIGILPCLLILIRIYIHFIDANLNGAFLFFCVNVTRVIIPISRHLMPAKQLNWAFEYEMIQSRCQFRSWDSKCIPSLRQGIPMLMIRRKNLSASRIASEKEKNVQKVNSYQM